MNLNLKPSSKKTDEEKNFSNRALRRLKELEAKSDDLEKEYMTKNEFSSKGQIKSLKKQNRITTKINRITKRQEGRGRTRFSG
tara:strand:- start:341 stop:589 length:249 start_codon:yes stop_codon:yes gene_type:complete